jgi:hypothetical protein
LDQFVVNVMLRDVDWEVVEHVDGEWRSTFSVCDYQGAKICVLGARDIARDYDFSSAFFGNHAGRLDLLYRHPWLSRTQARTRVAMWSLHRMLPLLSLPRRVGASVVRRARRFRHPATSGNPGRR